jgi:hypothetical protein
MNQRPPLTLVKDREKVQEGPKYAQYGIALGKPVLRALEKRGIYCHAGVSIEHQHLAKRYVLRGTESGGAVADMARYCAYFDSEGRPLPWLQPLDSLSGNGRHAVIIAPEVVRVDMLRIGRTYELAISRHSLSPLELPKRPSINSTLLFRGHQGTLAIELWKEEQRKLRGSVSPVFYTPAGESKPLPEIFEDAVRKITGALSCLGCKHTHAAVPPAALFPAPQEVRHGGS